MGSLRVVLLRPKRAENLGAIARAMKNFGIGDWVAVNPEGLDREAAKLVATQSRELVDELRVVDSLDEAVADCIWVVGTSSRTLRGLRRLEPQQVGAECVARRQEGPVAIVFGDESSGLRNEELLRVHAVSALPTDDAQPSVNLAQAVLLYLYEHRRAELLAHDRKPPRLPRAASDAELELIHSHLSEVASVSGFLHREGDTVVRELLAPFRRSRLTRREAALWKAVLGNLRKRL